VGFSTNQPKKLFYALLVLELFFLLEDDLVVVGLLVDCFFTVVLFGALL